MSLRSFLDDVAPHFEKGGRFAWAFPAYEAVDTRREVYEVLYPLRPERGPLAG